MTPLIASLALAALALAGCASHPAPTAGVGAATHWREPDDYSFTLTSSCGERALIGTFQVTVADGEVTKAAGLDDSARRAVENSGLSIVPTLAGILTELDAARSENAYVADAEFAEGDGHPTKVTIDPDRESLDDEACYAVSGYRSA